MWKEAFFYKRRHPDLDLDEMFNAGMIGLLKACKTFEPERGNQFSTFATWWVRQSVQRWVEAELKQAGWIFVHPKGKKGRWTRTVAVSTFSALQRESWTEVDPIGAPDFAANPPWARELIVRHLSPRSAYIVELNVIQGHTLEAIGDVLGVSRERVRQLRDKALRKLKRPVQRVAETCEDVAASIN